MKNSIKSVLVMGGAGYLGSMLTEQLIEAGFKVTIFDSLLFTDNHTRVAEHFRAVDAHHVSPVTKH